MALLIVNSFRFKDSEFSSHLIYEVPEERLSEAKSLFQTAWEGWFNRMDVFPTAKEVFETELRSHCISFKEIQRSSMAFLNCHSDGGPGLVFTSQKAINGISEIKYLMKAMGLATDMDLVSMIQAKGLDCRSYGEDFAKSFCPSREDKESISGVTNMFVILMPSGENYLEILKNVLGNYLPDDFDWDAHLGCYAATLCSSPA